MQPPDFRMARTDRLNPIPFHIGQFSVEKHIQSLTDDRPDAYEYQHDDDQAEQRVNYVEVPPGGDEDRGEDRDITSW